MITEEPNPILHRECRDLDWSEVKSLAKILKKEWDIYQNDNPEVKVVGLAAPQVGKAVRAFLAFDELFINPEIIGNSPGQIEVREGCCSLPGHSVYLTKRNNEVTLRWFTPARQLKTNHFHGSYSAVIQHEMDHLSGRVISEHGILQT